MKKKMRCHPIVLLAGLLTVVRAQGQFSVRHPSVLFILTLRFLWRQLCLLTLRFLPLSGPVYSLRCIYISRRRYFYSLLRGTIREFQGGLRCFSCRCFLSAFCLVSLVGGRSRDTIVPRAKLSARAKRITGRETGHVYLHDVSNRKKARFIVCDYGYPHRKFFGSN